MSGVDVLAVMDTAAAAIEGSWAIYEGPKDLIAARNVVAELLTELLACQAFLGDMHTQTVKWTVAESQVRLISVSGLIAKATP